MKEDLVNSFKSELDQCGIGSDAFFDAKMIVDRMDIMERSIVQKLEARVDKFAADDGAVVSTSVAVDVEHVHDEITQVCVRASKSSAYNFVIGKGGSMKRVPKIFFPYNELVSAHCLLVLWRQIKTHYSSLPLMQEELGDQDNDELPHKDATNDKHC